jgi:Superinfection immunity protein
MELLLLVILALAVYLLPAFVAYVRGHPNAMAITVLNIFLGWTFLGWVGALVWSFTKV